MGPIGRTAHRIALAGEKVVHALDWRDKGSPVIDPYYGYASPDTLVLRGRVLGALRRTEPDPTHNRLANARQMISLFLTNEVAGVPVASGEHRAVSDEEGYFTLAVPRPRAAAGWYDVPVRIEGEPDTEVAARALVPPADAPAMVISDIDDTVLKTGAYSLARNLWTSLTGNALTRTVFPDAARLLADLDAAGCPLFFVSSSPWNMHAFLLRVFEGNGVPPGPMFLRDLGVSRDKFVKSGHGDHKGAAIDELMATHPGLPAILVGDTGQHDAEIYAAAAGRWPGRVLAILLREARPGCAGAAERALAARTADGPRVHVVADFSNVPALVPG